jgi:hypothetical protein
MPPDGGGLGNRRASPWEVGWALSGSSGSGPEERKPVARGLVRGSNSVGSLNSRDADRQRRSRLLAARTAYARGDFTLRVYARLAGGSRGLRGRRSNSALGGDAYVDRLGPSGSRAWNDDGAGAGVDREAMDLRRIAIA